MDRELSSFPSLTGNDNTNWETATAHMSVAEEATRNSICRFNNPVECWGCTNPPKYPADRFHTYRNFPNKMEPDVAERENQS